MGSNTKDVGLCVWESGTIYVTMADAIKSQQVAEILICHSHKHNHTCAYIQWHKVTHTLTHTHTHTLTLTLLKIILYWTIIKISTAINSSQYIFQLTSAFFKSKLNKLSIQLRYQIIVHFCTWLQYNLSIELNKYFQKEWSTLSH